MVDPAASHMFASQLLERGDAQGAVRTVESVLMSGLVNESTASPKRIAGLFQTQYRALLEADKEDVAIALAKTEILKRPHIIIREIHHAMHLKASLAASWVPDSKWFPEFDRVVSRNLLPAFTAAFGDVGYRRDLVGIGFDILH